MGTIEKPRIKGHTLELTFLLYVITPKRGQPPNKGQCLVPKCSIFGGSNGLLNTYSTTGRCRARVGGHGPLPFAASRVLRQLVLARQSPWTCGSACSAVDSLHLLLVWHSHVPLEYDSNTIDTHCVATFSSFSIRPHGILFLPKDTLD